MRFHAIPLADHGFIDCREHNPVRWYVEDDLRPQALLGPYDSVDAADTTADRLNEVIDA